MICPRCNENELESISSNYLICNNCGLKRRPEDKIVLNKHTNCYFLNRNVINTNRGDSVTISQCGQAISSTLGILESDTSYVMKRVDYDSCLAFSDDASDLVLFAIDKGWLVESPSELVELSKQLQN